MRPLQFARKFLQIVVLIGVCAVPAFPQIGQIDKSKLPQTDAVQHVYTDLLPIEQYARTYEATWRFPVPKTEVAARFLSDLHTLEEAQKQDSSNKELQLFTGLVAHLAYNLDIDEAYNPAIKLLQPLANGDYRATWFLGMHQCQSNDPVGGMQKFLRVETQSAQLPRAFWQDYADCATVSDMPVHAVRAYDNANRIPDGPPTNVQLEQIARNRIKPSSITASYPSKQVWFAEQSTDRVRFVSNLCGESFTTKPTPRINIGDVAKGSCVVTIDTDQYPDRHGSSSATLLMLTQVASPNETLEAYAERFLKDPRYANRKPITGIHCPVSSCLAYEIITDKLYKSEGGAHLLAIFFQSNEPEYPGLRFETPQPLPKASNSASGSTFIRPEEYIQRFNGTLYTFMALDANEDIYGHARIDFDNLLKSMTIDSK